MWELPRAKDQYVVIEGNTRTTVLRKLRSRLEAERNKLTRIEKSKKGYSPEAVEQLRNLVDHLEKVKKDTTRIHAMVVNAATTEELEAILPSLHSVRHINHANPWSPYATNLYMLEEYRKLHRRRYPGKLLTKLEDDLVKQVADMVSTSVIKARRNLQAACAFSGFKVRYEDQLPTPEDSFSERDHYFFEIIMQRPFLREQFGVGMNDLQLDAEKEPILFQWAFSKSRKKEDGKPNPNILQLAEDLKLWNDIKDYDDTHGTSFHMRLNALKPDEAIPMAESRPTT